MLNDNSSGLLCLTFAEEGQSFSKKETIKLLEMVEKFYCKIMLFFLTQQSSFATYTHS
jgi:hypothetical protein